MPYIGRAATNAGSVRYLDNIASGFDGSDVTFTAQVGGVSITPGQENINLYLDGVFQHPGSGNAYTLSGSTITFTAAPVANTVFTAYVVGEGAYLDDATVITAKIGDDAITAAKLDDDGTGFQVGDLGVGGSLTSGDKLTVTGRLRASGGIIGALTGNASTATALATARTIGGTSFDGTANIAVALAATATTLATARAINGVNFNGSAAITVTADANTLSNTTLKSTVVSSSLTSVGTLTALTVDDITINGSTISDSGDFTLDVGGTIILDGDTAGDNIHLKDSGIHYGSIVRNNSDLEIRVVPQDEDIVFRGNDGGSQIDALKLDMSAGGAAFFNGDISAGSTGDLNARNATFSGNITLANNKYLNIDDSGGTTKNIIGLSSGNVVEIAGSNNAVTFGSGGATFSGAVTVHKASGDATLTIDSDAGGDPTINLVTGNNRDCVIDFKDGSTVARFNYDHANTRFEFKAHNQSDVDAYIEEGNAAFTGQVKTGKIYTQEGNGTIDGSGNGDGSLVDTPYTVTLDMPEGSHILTATMGRTEVHMIATYLIHCAPYASSVINCSVTQLAKNAYGGNSDITVTNQNNSTAFGFNSTSAGEIKITFINDDSTAWQYWDWSYICLNNK